MNHGQHPSSGSQSPPLPNFNNLAISGYSTSPGPQNGAGIGGMGGGGDYRYSGVFGPPVPGPQSGGWGSPNKRASRSGLPQNWYEATSSRESPIPIPPNHYDGVYRRDASSPPALSPPSSTTSGPTTSSSNLQSNLYQPYHQPGPGPGGPMPAPQPQMPIFPAGVDPSAFASMGVTPSPPPQLGYGMSSNGSAPNMQGFSPNGLPTYGSQSLASIPPHGNGMGGAGAGRNGVWTNNGFGLPPLDDDVIPTAIVIKNIPFAVPREQLLGVIESLGAPLPYAFNYHHDNGIFRGLAFANFRAPEEAASVVAALNGYDVQGRKLRVEYKKVLQPGEKDKIEREKALKRMRSIQFDHNGQPSSSSSYAKEMPAPLNISDHNLPIGSNRHNSSANGIPGRHSADLADHSPPQSASSGNSSDLPLTLDLNNPTALDIYSRVLVFKEDRMRDELAFSKSLTPTERRIVHLVAQKLGLVSITRSLDGASDAKYVVVTRDGINRPNNASSNSNTTSTSAYLSPYSTSANTDSLSPSLRIKKSMPDLRGFNGPVVARDPARSLTPQRSSGNLRGGYVGGGGEGGGGSREYVSMGAAGGRRVNGHHSHSHSNSSGYLGSGSGNFNSFFGSSIGGDIPPVPPLPAGLGLHSSSASLSASPAPLHHHSSSPNPLNQSNQSSQGGQGQGTSGSHHSKSSMSSNLSNYSTSGNTLNPSSGMHNGPSSSPDLSDLSNAAPLRNPRGPASDGRGFGGLRNSASGILRSNTTTTSSSGGGSAGAGIIGKRFNEEDENSSVGQDESAEMPRTRESLEL